MAISVEHFQHQQNPFLDAVDELSYFEDEQRAEISQKLIQLVEFGTSIPYIYGELESGKSTLLRHLAETKKQNWRCCYITAEQANDVDSFLRLIATQYGVEHRDTENMLQRLADHLTETHANGKLATLLIDDADKLRVPLYKLIAAIANISLSGQLVLRVILAGKLIPPQLIEFVEDNKSKTQLTPVFLPPLNEEQTSVYIGHHLTVAQSDQTSIFDPHTVAKIYKASKGQPGHINAMASSLLQGQNASKLNKSSKENSHGQNHFALKLVALALAISVIISLFMFSNTQQPSSTEAALPENSINDEFKTAQLDLPEPTLTQRQQERASIQNPKPDIPKIEVVSPSSGKIETDPAIPEKMVPRKPAINDISSTNTFASQATTAKKIDNQEDTWLDKQDPSHFSLQLIGVSKKTSALAYIKQYKIDDMAHAIESTRKNKPWYSIVYGSFPTRGDAQKAIKTLPSDLQKTKPWIRTIASIKESAGE